MFFCAPARTVAGIDGCGEGRGRRIGKQEILRILAFWFDGKITGSLFSRMETAYF
jgi:hypothetical protein